MTLLEKIKINIDYLLGKADPSLYAEGYKSPDWQKRWQLFSEYDCFSWFAIDSEGNIAEFRAVNTYIPEIYFDNPFLSKKISAYFDSLPEITKGKVSPNFREKIKFTAEREESWAQDSNKGLFIFEEPEDIYWCSESNIEKYKYKKTPYELKSLPQKVLRVSDLPDLLQNRLKFFQFENIKFEDCQFLDVSKYFYCEE